MTLIHKFDLDILKMCLRIKKKLLRHGIQKLVYEQNRHTDVTERITIRTHR